MALHDVRILFVSNLYPPETMGGAERVTAQQAEQLAAVGHDVHVLTTRVGEVGLNPRWQRQRMGGVNVHRMTSAFPYHFSRRPPNRLSRVPYFLLDLTNPLHARRVRALVRHLQPDRVVFGNLWNIGSGVWSAIGPGIRTIQVLHDGALVCMTGLMRHGMEECRGQLLPCRIPLQLRRGQSSRLDAVVAPSNWLLNAVTAEAGLFPRAARAVLPNPSPPVGKGTANMQRTIGDTLHALYLGQLERHKGPLVLAAAIKGMEGVTCTMAGDGSLRPELSREAAANMTLPGEVDGDLKNDLLSRATVVVVPSICNENSPSVIYEALACGRPVIASRSGGIPELVRDGVEGLLVPPGDAVALRNALSRIRDEPGLASSLSAAARARSEQLAELSSAERLLEV